MPLTAREVVIVSYSQQEIKKNTFWRSGLIHLMKRKAFVFGASMLIICIVVAIVIPLLSQPAHHNIDLIQRNIMPSKKYFFGTDDLGRNLLVRTCIGAQISLFVGLLVAFIDTVIGVLYGGIAALLGGKIGEAMLFVIEILQATPYLLFVILLTSFLGHDMFTLIFSLAIVGWTNVAYIVRAQILTFKKKEFVLAANSFGVPPVMIMWRHLIPNLFGVIVDAVTMIVSRAIFMESMLSFLGLGIQPPLASLGSLICDGSIAISSYPHRLFFPSALVSIIIFSLHMLGEGLRDAFNPRYRFF